jgi:HlyD family secretion protein
MPRELQSLRLLRRFETEIGDIRDADEPRWVHATVLSLAAFLALSIGGLWVARVDRVVSSSAGKIVSVEPTTVFQALDASIVRSIDVREGEIVEAGQVLATLDPTFAAADVQQLRKQIKSLDAQISRGEAELKGTDLTFAPTDDAEARGYETLQLGLFRQRAAQYRDQVASYNAKIAQTEATIAKFEGDEARYRERLQIADKVQSMRGELLERGAGSLLNMLVSTDAKLEAERTMEFGHNSLLEAQHARVSLQADREAFEAQWRTSVSQELVTARNARDAAASQLEKAEKHRDLVRLVAPQRSMVFTLARISVGSVLKEGDTLMTLTPMSAPLEAEVQIASRDVGFVRPGDAATIKVDAFNFAEHGVAEGKVRWISQDAFTTDDNGAPAPAYYRARIDITAEKFIDVPPSFRLIPGMTLSADVAVGTRSLGLYLLGGLFNAAGEAMREP